MGKLLLLFVAVPILEAILLAKIGDAIGWTNTIALVVVTGVVGAWLFKLEGGRAWRRWQRALATGQTPEDGVLGGLLLLLGGAFLITPGVVTDAVGLLLLLPFSRHALAHFLRPRIMRRFFEGQGSGGSRFQVFQVGFGEPANRRGSSPFDVEVVDSEPPSDEEPSGPQDAVVVGRRVPVQRKRMEEPKVIDADFEVLDREA